MFDARVAGSTSKTGFKMKGVPDKLNWYKQNIYAKLEFGFGIKSLDVAKFKALKSRVDFYTSYKI